MDDITVGALLAAAVVDDLSSSVLILKATTDSKNETRCAAAEVVDY